MQICTRARTHTHTHTGDVRLEARVLARLQDMRASVHAHVNDDVMVRLEREGARVGDVTISLVWNDFNDLDLHVHAPSGVCVCVCVCVCVYIYIYIYVCVCFCISLFNLAAHSPRRRLPCKKGPQDHQRYVGVTS